MKQLVPSPRPSRWWLPALAVVLFSLAAPVGAEIIERVIVKVNGEVFTKTDLESRQTAIIRRQNPPVTNDAELKKAIDTVTPQLLVNTVDEMLLVQRGKELGYRLDDKNFEEIVKRLKADNKIETDEQFQAALKADNLTMGALRSTLERQYIIEKVENAEVLSHIQVNEAEARKYYDEHTNEFTSVPTVTLREILVKVPGDAKGVNAAADDEAKQKAAAIRARALKGEDFGKLAEELSEAPTKSNGGLVGPFKRTDLDAQFAKVLESMKVGDITEPIRTATGYDVVKLEASTPIKVLSFTEARDQIANRVFGSKQQAAFDVYLKKLRASAILDWKVPELKKLYDEQLSRGPAPAAPGL